MLVTMCDTRFVERHDALLVFVDQYTVILKALDVIGQQSHDRKALDKARALGRAITDSGFVVALCCAKKVMAVTIILSRSLQTINQDLFEAMESVKYVENTLQSWRTDDNEWESADCCGAYVVAQQLATSVNIVLDVPRLASKQTCRNNVQFESTSQYFKRAIWYPYVDSILTAVNEKFSSHQLLILKLVAFVPSLVHRYDWPDVVESCSLYKSQLDSLEEVRNEFYQWKELVKSLTADKRPATPLQALDVVPQRLRNIKTLLVIFCTLPVSTCTAERSFSSMKLLKNYLRSTMTDDRLSGLALMYIHPEIDINVTEIIERFCSLPTTESDRADDNNTNVASKRRRIDD